MKKILWAFLALPGLAAAASVNITWVPSATAVDGTPMTGAQAATSVQVWVATAPILDTSTAPPTVTLTATATSTTQTIAANVGQTIYTRVKVCNQWGCSDFSNTASKLVPGSVPGVPTNVTITLTITP